MNPKKKIQKHQLTEGDTKWLFDNYNPERDGYNGWLLEIPRDEQVVVLSVACERPIVQTQRDYIQPSNTSVWHRPLMEVPEMYFEVIQPVTDGIMDIIRDFGSTGFESERRGRVGYKKNMTLTRYIHGAVSEKYHLIGCMMTNCTFLDNNDGDQTISFTLSCDHFILTT